MCFVTAPLGGSAPNRLAADLGVEVRNYRCCEHSTPLSYVQALDEASTHVRTPQG